MAYEFTDGLDYPDSSIAAANLEFNRQALAKKTGNYPNYTPPSPGHYWNWYLWDEVFHVIIDARHGSEASLRVAQAGLNTTVENQDEDGFIANTQRLGAPKRWLELEDHDDPYRQYSQPPVLALGLAEVYRALKNQTGLEDQQPEVESHTFAVKIFDRATRSYKHLGTHRRASENDRRMFIIHPHETGRDSDPTYDYLKPFRLPRHGIATPFYVDKANTLLDYGQILWFEKQLKKAKGDIETVRSLFGAHDLMMNCMLVDNLRIMTDLAAELGRDEDQQYFSLYAHDVEQQVLSKMWVPEARAGRGAFYSTDKNDVPIIETTVNNLAPLLLPNLSENQLESLLDVMDESFNVNFPLPSVGTTSRSYDPHYRELERLWRGGTWINLNWYYAERGLREQAKNPAFKDRPDLVNRCLYWDDRITKSSRNLLSLSGPREFYDPDRGNGQRWRTKSFGWSNLGYVSLPAAAQTEVRR